MKLIGALSFVLGCSVISASSIPRTASGSSHLISESRQGQGVNHWVADPIAKEAFPLTKATGARGGGELNVKHNTSLWAALCFNAVGALCAAFKSDLISSHLMTVGGDVSGWSTHFLAIMWAGAAAHTFLSIQDGSSNVVAISRKVNVATTGLACLLGVWQYSQGVYDHQHAVAAIAITGVVTGCLIKGHCDTCK